MSVNPNLSLIDAINTDIDFEKTNLYQKQLNNIENSIKLNLNISDPTLVKTGALGNIINLITHAKIDNKIFLKNLVNQLNPVTADTFSSLAFHAGLCNYNISFANPSTYTIQFLIPEIDFSANFENELFKYTISPGCYITSSTGFSFNIEDKIEIIQKKSGVFGTCFSKNQGNYNLEVSKVQNPTNKSTNIFLINYTNLKQYKRTFYLYPLYNSLDSNLQMYINTFNIKLNDISKLNEINVWKRKVNIDEPVFILNNEIFNKYISEEFVNVFNLEKQDIKYNTFSSNNDSKDVFLDFGNNNVNITTGNGITGEPCFNGEYLLIEIKETEGMYANSNFITSDDMVFNRVTKEILNIYNNNVKTSGKSDIKAIALQGGRDGTNIETIKELQTNIGNLNSTRNNITSLNDFTIHFTRNGIEPFIDTKYFNSNNNYFIYNLFKYDNKILKTDTVNLLASELEINPFFPTKTIKNIETFSPFYYKKEKNHFKAFIVNSNIEMSFDSSVPKYDSNRISNNIGLYLIYDFVEKSSYLKLSNTNADYKYIISTDKFEATLDATNGFTFQINTRYLDSYCLLNDPIRSLNINVLDKDSNFIINFFNRNCKYFQLEHIQNNFIFQDTVSTNKQNYVINLPFMEITFRDIIFDKNNTGSNSLSANLLRNFFTSLRDKNMYAPNINITQSFYNTIYIDDTYKDYIFKFNDNGNLLTTENMLKVDLIIDNKKFIDSEFTNIGDLEFSIKEKLIMYLYTKQGFSTNFFETEIEKLISNTYSFIKNIEIKFPKKFQINDTETIYYNMEEALLKNELSMKQIIDFTPFYIYYNENFIIFKTVLI